MSDDTQDQTPLDPTDPLAVVGQMNPPGPIPRPGPEFERIDPVASGRGAPSQQQPQVIVMQQGRQRRDPQPPREKTPPKTPLQQALPNPERVKIGRRRSDGHVATIGFYNWADIQRYGSVEGFLAQVLVPTYRGGDYELHYVKPDGTLEPRGIIPMEDPPTPPPTAQVTPLDQVVQLAQRLRDDATRSAPPAVNPVQQLQELMALQKQMGGGNDSMLMMMAMQAMQAQREPQRDPMEATMRMLEMVRAMQPPPPPPPLPLPPPMPSGPDPMMMMMLEQQKMQMQMQIEQMKAQAENQRVMFDALRNQDKGPSAIELLQLTQSMQPKDALGARDILPMIGTVKELVRPPEKDGLREHLEALRLLKGALNDIGADQKGSGFREFAEGLLPNGIDSITQLIQTVRQKEAAQAADLQQPLQGQQEQPPPQKLPHFPPGFSEYGRAINKAKDPIEAMGAAITAFVYLAQSPDFRPAYETLIRHARGGEKEKVLDLVQGFLVGIGRAGLITEEAANLVLQGIDEHWDDVVNTLIGGGNAKPEGAKEGAKVVPMKPPTTPAAS